MGPRDSAEPQPQDGRRCWFRRNSSCSPGLTTISLSQASCLPADYSRELAEGSGCWGPQKGAQPPLPGIWGPTWVGWVEEIGLNHLPWRTVRDPGESMVGGRCFISLGEKGVFPEGFAGRLLAGMLWEIPPLWPLALPGSSPYFLRGCVLGTARTCTDAGSDVT